MRQQGPTNRSARRRTYNAQYTNVTKVKMPGLLGVLTNPKVFVVAMVLMGGAMIFSVLPGISGGVSSVDESGQVRQSGEIEDAPRNTPTDPSQPSTSGSPTIKRYVDAPALTIDTSKKYLATVRTDKGNIQIELDPSLAPEAVNSFVFLAREGYYNGNPFIGTKDRTTGEDFTLAAGDPTGTGNVKPGFTLRSEITGASFDVGSVGMGNGSSGSVDGRFWISLVDEPALDGKNVIFGRVVSGMDVLTRLSGVDAGQPDAAADKILSVDISEL